MIEHYEFGRIVVDGQRYTSDVIIYPDRVDSNWWRNEGHELCPADLREVVQAQPEVLVVGTGQPGRMRVLPETERHLEEQGIELVVQRTTDACRIYDQLREAGQNVIAALHLTC